MTEPIDVVYQVALFVTLWATVVPAGLSTSPRDLGVVVGRPGLLARVAALNLVAAPVLMWVLVSVVGVPVAAAAGLLVVGAASAGALGLKAAQLARGDLALATGLVVLLQLSNIVVVPFWTQLLLGARLTLSPVEIMLPLVVGVLVPFVIGAGLRVARRGTGRARLLDTVSSVGLGVVIATIVAREGPALLEVALSGVALVAILWVAGVLLAGWLAGGPERPTRAAIATVSGIRANAAALAVVTVAFGPASDAVSAVAAFALVAMVVVPAAALVIGGRWRVGLRRATSGLPAEPIS